MNIFVNKATQERAENTRMLLFGGVLALGDLVNSTLRPKGWDVLLNSVLMQEQKNLICFILSVLII
ncbi:hypothetical protein VP01_13940g1 [Puccinia sorghi]|uniref:Uncharacterized protein n=1 Tax=Puccinia sorghi TaxID=27349 RepID=A0A0L6VL41_9BASI|nr:hypothetical protein VP01_13940g1 [Puccinia sorghi]